MISRTVLGFVLLFSFFIQPSFADNTTLTFKHMFVLGDSISDQGNVFFATSDLGPALGLGPVPRSDYYYMGRFSNAENYAGLLAQKLGVTLRPSELGGNNYAFGGSRTNYNRLEITAPPQAVPSPSDGKYPTGAYPWSLDLQRQAFLADVKPRRADPNGLYVVFAGSNDLSDALAAALFFGQDPTPIITNAVQGIRNVITAFETAGARTVLVANMPNLGVVPAVTALGNTPEEKAQIQGFATGLSALFNAQLADMLEDVTHTNILVFDTFSFLTDIVAHPGNYGLTNVTQPCYSGFVEPIPDADAPTVCAEPHDYAFWDREHPTTHFHAILAEELYSSVLHCEAKKSNRKHSTRGRFTARCTVNVH